MGSVLTWLAGKISPDRVPKDIEGIEAFWEARKHEAARRLGSFKEARAVIAELVAAKRCPSRLAELLDAHRDARELTEDDDVGDPNDVHHIIPPCHTVGFAVETCEDGYALETLETLHMRWSVLRRHGRMVAVGEMGMLRMESYRGCHVV